MLPRRLEALFTPADADDSPALAAGSVEVGARTLRLESGWCSSFAITGYPAEVGPGWLEPLLTYPGRLDVSLHVEPVAAAVAADQLRKRLARLESGRRADAEHGRLADFDAETATADAYDMATALARGESKLFRFGLYLTVHAPDAEALEAEVAQVRALAASMLLDTQPATFRTLQGWVTASLPLAVDRLAMRRTMDTPAIATAFPFTSPDLPVPAGPHAVVYGANTASSSLVIWDRFTGGLDNHNAVILARSGAGKSYLAKLETLRSLYTGVQVLVIDPENEYQRLADAVGGTCIDLGAPGVHLNPFDLDPSEPDALTRRALFIHTLVAVLLDGDSGGHLDSADRTVLDRAVIAAYQAKGITSDPRTWRRPAPLLADLIDALAADDHDAGPRLAERLAPFVTGSFQALFAGPTTTRPDGHLIVYSLRHLADELKPTGTLLALDAIWRTITNPTTNPDSSRGADPGTNPGTVKPRLVTVDEGWQLLQSEAGAKFLYKLAKSARKHGAGLTVITQDAADVLGSDLGRAVVANAATQILLRQAPQAIDQITTAFGLSAGERAYVLAAGRGQALLTSGTHRAGFCAEASPAEHALITTDPDFLTGADGGEDL